MAKFELLGTSHAGSGFSLSDLNPITAINNAVSNKDDIEDNRGDFKLPWHGPRHDRLVNRYKEFAARGAPRVGDSGFRSDQAAQVDRLTRRATGRDSVTGLQLRQAMGQGLAQQRALAASARPGQGALAARMAAQNAGTLTQGLAGQAALARMQEQRDVESQLAGVVQGARGQDYQYGFGNAGLSLQQQQQNDQAEMEARRLELQNAMAQQQGLTNYNQVLAGTAPPGLSWVNALSTGAGAFGAGGGGGGSAK
jgi:hypothetical protein